MSKETEKLVKDISDGKNDSETKSRLRNILKNKVLERLREVRGE